MLPLFTSYKHSYLHKANLKDTMAEYISIKDTVLKQIEENLPEICERFGIETLGIFGSVSRGEDTEESDVDVLYHFKEGRGGLISDAVPLKQYLENLFGREVDLVSVNYVSPLIREYVVTDAILYGKEMAIA